MYVTRFSGFPNESKPKQTRNKDEFTWCMENYQSKLKKAQRQTGRETDRQTDRHKNEVSNPDSNFRNSS